MDELLRNGICLLNQISKISKKTFEITHLFKYKLEYLRRYFPLAMLEMLFGNN